MGDGRKGTREKTVKKHSKNKGRKKKKLPDSDDSTLSSSSSPDDIGLGDKKV